MDRWPPGAEELLDLGAAAAVDPAPRGRALDPLGGDAARRLIAALDHTGPVRRVQDGVRVAGALVGLRHLVAVGRGVERGDPPDLRLGGGARREPIDPGRDPVTADLIAALERWLAAGPVPPGSWRWGAVLHRSGVERWAEAARDLPDPLTTEVLDLWVADALHPAAAAELRQWAARGPALLRGWIVRRLERIEVAPVVPGEIVASLPVVPGESWLVGTAVDHRRTRWLGPGLEPVELDGDGVLRWGDPITGPVQTAVHWTETGAWGALDRCAAACRAERRPEHRALLADRLGDPALLREVDDARARFEAGADPEDEDERKVAAVVRARAILAATAPDPDPLAPALVELDRRWARCEQATWMLDDDVWRACFPDPTPPPVDRWWGARADPAAPSGRAVLSAMAELARIRRSLAAGRRTRGGPGDAS